MQENPVTMLSYILIFSPGGDTIYTERQTQQISILFMIKYMILQLPKAPGHPGGFWCRARPTANTGKGTSNKRGFHPNNSDHTIIMGGFKIRPFFSLRFRKLREHHSPSQLSEPRHCSGDSVFLLWLLSPYSLSGVPDRQLTRWGGDGIL